MPMPFIFNNSKFEQILQIHAVSKKSLYPTKTKVKYFREFHKFWLISQN